MASGARGLLELGRGVRYPEEHRGRSWNTGYKRTAYEYLPAASMVLKKRLDVSEAKGIEGRVQPWTKLVQYPSLHIAPTPMGRFAAGTMVEGKPPAVIPLAPLRVAQKRCCPCVGQSWSC